MNSFFQNNKKRIIIGACVLVVVLTLVIVIPVALVSGSDKKEPDGLKPYNPADLSDDEKSRINCFLEAESKFENFTQYLCEQRGCIYKTSEYERVPICFFNRTNIGYLLDTKVNETEYKLKLDHSAKLPYLGAIENLRLSVEFLGDAMVHVKVFF